MEIAAIKWCIWGYFQTFTLIAGDLKVAADSNTDVALRNCTPFFTCKTPTNYLFIQNNSATFETETIESSLWDYFDAFVLVKGDITVTADDDTDDAVTNWGLLSTCKTEINDLFKQTNSTKFETECIKSGLWDYFGALISVTGDITVTADNNTDVAFTTFAPFSKCKTKINDLFKQSKSIEFETESIKSSLWDYFEAFILIAWYITVTADNNNKTDVAFTNSTPFSTCKTPINYLFEQTISVNFETESIKWSLWRYFDGFF